jgi:hypothetical protein
MDQDSKRFTFAEDFIRKRNGPKVIPMTDDSPNVNRTMSQFAVVCLLLVVRSPLVLLTLRL